MRFLLLTWGFRMVNAKTVGTASSPWDECWQQWNQFWTANGSVSYSSTLLRAPPTTTTYVTAKTVYSAYHTEYTTTSTHTRVKFLGPAGDPHAQTRTLISDIVETYDGNISTVMEAGLSYTTTETQENTASYYSIITIQPNISTPSCTLPAQYPPCQSQWDAWAGADIRADEIEQPLCSQAKVEGSTCQKVISNFYSGVGVFGATGIPGWVTSGDSTFWPTSQTFAPGCTLGCQRCAIMGDKVRILYWPASSATAVENGTAIATLHSTANASSNASSPQTTVLEGKTLTSPTIYISYKTLYGSNSCSGVGRTFSNTIIPLTNSRDLHSLAYKALDDHGAGPAMNGIQYLSWEYEERPFNFTDLEEPIPDAVYDQLPYCQMQYRGYTLNGMQDSMQFSCTREGPYNPIIAVPPEVRNLDPAWKTCTGWYAGLYDPPRALQGAASAATPTAPVEATSASAEPVATLTNDGPKHTKVSITTQLTAESSHAVPSTMVASSVGQDPRLTGVGGFIVSAIIGGGVDDPAASSSSDPRDQPSADSAHKSSAAVRTALIGNGGSRDKPVPTSSQSPGMPNGEQTATTTTFRAGGHKHTLRLDSAEPILDGSKLSPGELTVLGTRTISVGASAIYIDGAALAKPTPTAPQTTHPNLGVPFTITDTLLGNDVYTAYTVPGHPKEVVVDGLTLTQGAPYKAFDLYLISLGTDGVLYTVPIDRSPLTSARSSSSSTGSLVPSARLWTPSSATGSVSAGAAATSGAPRRETAARMWCLYVGLALLAVVCRW